MVALAPRTSASRYLLRHSAYSAAAAARRSRLVSKAEKTQRKRERAIQWMLRAVALEKAQKERAKAMAAGGGAEATGSDSQGGGGGGGSGTTSESTNEMKGGDRDGDDVDQLIEWATELDFSSYLTEWTRVGTSEASNAKIERRNELKRLREDLIRKLDAEEKEAFLAPVSETIEEEALDDSEEYHYDDMQDTQDGSTRSVDGVMNNGGRAPLDFATQDGAG